MKKLVPIAKHRLRAFLAQYDLRKEASLFAGATIVITLGALPMAARSTGIPVVDALNVTQTTITALNSVESVVQLAESVKRLQSNLEAITGTHGYGALMESVVQKDARRWMPADWSAAVSAHQSGGSGASAALNAFMSAIAQDFPAVQDEEFVSPETRAESIRAYKQSLATTQMSSAVAEGAYNDTRAQFDRIESLNQSVDATPDLKSAIDLQNRMQGEMNFQLAKANQLKSIEMKMAAAERQGDLSDKASAERYVNRPSQF